jgi:hypothetical protein
MVVKNNTIFAKKLYIHEMYLNNTVL